MLSIVIYILFYSGVSDEVVTENVVKIEMDMVDVAGGAFDMGCHSSREECLEDELPVHSVVLDSFRISKYEVTMTQWNAIMGDYPADYWNYPNCPVVQVSWDDVQLFISKLNEFTSKDYRLPTEAEWEYAAGGGRLSQNYLFSGRTMLAKLAGPKQRTKMSNLNLLEDSTLMNSVCTT